MQCQYLVDNRVPIYKGGITQWRFCKKSATCYVIDSNGRKYLCTRHKNKYLSHPKNTIHTIVSL